MRLRCPRHSAIDQLPGAGAPVELPRPRALRSRRSASRLASSELAVEAVQLRCQAAGAGSRLARSGGRPAAAPAEQPRRDPLRPDPAHHARSLPSSRCGRPRKSGSVRVRGGSRRPEPPSAREFDQRCRGGARRRCAGSRACGPRPGSPSRSPAARAAPPPHPRTGSRSPTPRATRAGVPPRAPSRALRPRARAPRGRFPPRAKCAAFWRASRRRNCTCPRCERSSNASFENSAAASASPARVSGELVVDLVHQPFELFERPQHALDLRQGTPPGPVIDPAAAAQGRNNHRRTDPGPVGTARSVPRQERRRRAAAILARRRARRHGLVPAAAPSAARRMAAVAVRIDLDTRQVTCSVHDLLPETLRRGLGAPGEGLARLSVGAELHRIVQGQRHVRRPRITPARSRSTPRSRSTAGSCGCSAAPTASPAGADGTPRRRGDQDPPLPSELHHPLAHERLERYRWQARLYALLSVPRRRRRGASPARRPRRRGPPRRGGAVVAAARSTAYLRARLHALVAAERARERTPRGVARRGRRAAVPVRGACARCRTRRWPRSRRRSAPGRHLLLAAPTGVGKTAAALYPAVQARARDRPSGRVPHRQDAAAAARGRRRCRRCRRGGWRSIQIRAKAKMCANREVICHEEFCLHARDYGVKLAQRGVLPALLSGPPPPRPGPHLRGRPRGRGVPVRGLARAAARGQRRRVRLQLRLRPGDRALRPRGRGRARGHLPDRGRGAQPGRPGARVLLAAPRPRRACARRAGWSRATARRCAGTWTTLLGEPRRADREHEVSGGPRLPRGQRSAVELEPATARRVPARARRARRPLLHLQAQRRALAREGPRGRRRCSRWPASPTCCRTAGASWFPWPSAPPAPSRTSALRDLLPGRRRASPAPCSRDPPAASRCRRPSSRSSSTATSSASTPTAPTPLSAALAVPAGEPPDRRCGRGGHHLPRPLPLVRPHRRARRRAGAARPQRARALPLLRVPAGGRHPPASPRATASRSSAATTPTGCAARSWRACAATASPCCSWRSSGGVFAEGVDYPGEMLSEVIVVSPALPQVGPERELLKAYFDDRYERGFEYAYLVPGMTRVVQAAGRLIRSAAGPRSHRLDLQALPRRALRLAAARRLDRRRSGLAAPRGPGGRGPRRSSSPWREVRDIVGRGNRTQRGGPWTPSAHPQDKGDHVHTGRAGHHGAARGRDDVRQAGRAPSWCATGRRAGRDLHRARPDDPRDPERPRPRHDPGRGGHDDGRRLRRAVDAAPSEAMAIMTERRCRHLPVRRGRRDRRRDLDRRPGALGRAATRSSRSACSPTTSTASTRADAGALAQGLRRRRAGEDARRGLRLVRAGARTSTSTPLSTTRSSACSTSSSPAPTCGRIATRPDATSSSSPCRARPRSSPSTSAGCVSETAGLATGGSWAVELPGGVWHTVVSLAEGTALFEVKPGPYRPLGEGDFAPWAPRDDTAGAAALLRRWEALAAAAALTPRG